MSDDLTDDAKAILTAFKGEARSAGGDFDHSAQQTDDAKAVLAAYKGEPAPRESSEREDPAEDKAASSEGFTQEQLKTIKAELAKGASLDKALLSAGCTLPTSAPSTRSSATKEPSSRKGRSIRRGPLRDAAIRAAMKESRVAGDHEYDLQIAVSNVLREGIQGIEDLNQDEAIEVVLKLARPIAIYRKGRRKSFGKPDRRQA